MMEMDDLELALALSLSPTIEEDDDDDDLALALSLSHDPTCEGESLEGDDDLLATLLLSTEGIAGMDGLASMNDRAWPMGCSDSTIARGRSGRGATPRSPLR